jgi:hypothetical protein
LFIPYCLGLSKNGVLFVLPSIEKVGNNHSKNNEINEIKEEGPSLYHSKYPKIYIKSE